MYYKTKQNMKIVDSKHNNTFTLVPTTEDVLSLPTFIKLANCFYKSVASGGYYVVPDEYMESVETFSIWFCGNDAVLEKSDSYRDVFYEYDEALNFCQKLNAKHTSIIYFPQKHKI